MKRLLSIIFVVILLLTIPFNISAFAEQGKDGNSFKYTDTDSGVTFTVPANWKQEELSKDREYIDVKFASTEEDGCIILYGSADLWAKMSAADKIGVTRSDLNNTALTQSDVAEMYGISADKVTTVTYNGTQYFKGEINLTADLLGVDVNASMTMLFYFDNGWMYAFQFGGTSTDKLYSDFESLLKSVQYPNSSNEISTSSTNNVTSTTSNNTSDNTSGIIAVVILLIVVIVIAVIAVISQKKRAEDTPEAVAKIEPTVYCKNCGQSLPLDSAFCHICGTKIEKE